MASTIVDPTNPTDPNHPSEPGRRVSAWRQNRAYFVGLAPATALLALFFVFPAGWALYSSFTNEALIGRDAQNPSWIGLDNYRRLVDDPDFVEVLKNSLVFVFGSAIVGQFAVGLGVALLIDHAESRRYRLTNLAYGAVLLAWVNPAIIAGFLWIAMYDFYFGSLNKGLDLLGFGPVNWLGDSPMLAVVVANVWRGTAFAMLIFIGALRTIPTQIYEAARVDGAGPWRRFWDHTLPNLRYVATLTLLSVTISTFGTFILIQTLTNGGPGIRTETIALYAYHLAFRDYEIGYGSSIAVVMLVLNLLFATFYLRVARPRS